MLYLDRIPPHAAVNEAVQIAKRRGHSGISGMVNGVLRSMERQLAELKLPNDQSGSDNAYWSHPFLPELAREALGEGIRRS